MTDQPQDVKPPEDAPEEIKEVASRGDGETKHSFREKRWWGAVSAFWIIFWLAFGVYIVLSLGGGPGALTGILFALIGMGASVSSTVDYLT